MTESISEEEIYQSMNIPKETPKFKTSNLEYLILNSRDKELKKRLDNESITKESINMYLDAVWDFAKRLELYNKTPYEVQKILIPYVQKARTIKVTGEENIIKLGHIEHYAFFGKIIKDKYNSII